MKQFLLPTLVFLFAASLISCSSTYMYSTLSSANEGIEKTEQGDFFYENDSLWISYSVRGKHTPLQVTVFNKLDKPLFIDWKKSLLVYNGIKHAYMRGDIVFTGDMYGKPYINTAVMDKKQMQNTLNTPQHVSCIPSKAMVSHRTFDLMVDLERYRKSKMDNVVLKKENGKSKEIDGLIFDYADSPLQITSYINTYYDNADSEQTYAIDLYMSNVLRTHTKPEKMISNMTERGDMVLYERKPSYRFWKNLGKGVAITGLAATSIVADAYLNRDE